MTDTLTVEFEVLCAAQELAIRFHPVVVRPDSGGGGPFPRKLSCTGTRAEILAIMEYTRSPHFLAIVQPDPLPDVTRP